MAVRRHFVSEFGLGPPLSMFKMTGVLGPFNGSLWGLDEFQQELTR